MCILNKLFSIFNFKKNIEIKKRKIIKKELNYYYYHVYYDSYSHASDIYSINDIKKFNKNNMNLVISTYFNGNHYPVLDIDSKIQYDLFCSVEHTFNYVSFSSSNEKDQHYWIIIDSPISDVNKYNSSINIDTKIICDQKYCAYTSEHQIFLLRADYKNNRRKPKLIAKVGVISDDLELFVTKFINHLNTEALRISALRYKTPELYIQYKRILKLNKIINGNDNKRQ